MSQQPRGTATASAPLATSTTITSTTATEVSTDVVVGTLSLRVPEASATVETTTGRSVVWAEEVVDNEFLDRKKSKGVFIASCRLDVKWDTKCNPFEAIVCCIYKKPRAFDESSTDESDSEDSEQGNSYDRQPDYTGKRKAERERRRRERNAHHHHHHHEDGCANAS